MVRTLQTTESGVNRVLTAVTLGLFLLMILVVGMQMLARWILGPMFGLYLSWTASLSRVLLVAVTFIGAAIASRDREHVTLDLVIKYLSPRMRRALVVFQSILIGGFLVVLLIGAREMYDLTAGRTFGALPSYPFLTNGWLYIYAIVGVVLMLLYLLRDIISVIYDDESPIISEVNE